MAPGRGRWTFTLRGALILLVVATLPLAYLARTVRRSENASAALQAKGVAVVPGAVNFGPETILRRAIGAADAPPHTVYGGVQVTDEDLATLAELPTVEILSLIAASITDDGLAPVAKLRGLKALYLGNTEIGDAGLARIRGLPALIEIHLHDTKITDAGLAHLATLPELQAVYLARTAVTDAGLEEFHRVRPDVAVFR